MRKSDEDDSGEGTENKGESKNSGQEIRLGFYWIKRDAEMQLQTEKKYSSSQTRNG